MAELVGSADRISPRIKAKVCFCRQCRIQLTRLRVRGGRGLRGPFQCEERSYVVEEGLLLDWCGIRSNAIAWVEVFSSPSFFVHGIGHVIEVARHGEEEHELSSVSVQVACEKTCCVEFSMLKEVDEVEMNPSILSRT